MSPRNRIPFLASLGGAGLLAAAAGALTGANPSDARTHAVQCSRKVASVGALQAAVGGARKDATICLRGGSYGAVRFGAARRTWVNVRNAPGERVQLADLDFGSTASHIRVRGMHVGGQVSLAENGANHIVVSRSWVLGFSARWGTHDIRFEHNDIRAPGGGNGVELVSQAPAHGQPEASNERLPPVSRVTIRGNRFHDIGTDAMIMGNYRDVLVEGNEISGLYERGQHTDALQSVWGGRRLTFRRNYVHDNRGEGVFIKDGRAYDVVVSDNLFVHTRDLWQISFYDCVPDRTKYGMRLLRNTVWDSNLPVDIMGTDNRSVQVRGNVFQQMLVDSPSAIRPHVEQDHNLIAGGWNWGARGAGDKRGGARFRNPARDDYRLRPGTTKFPAGITWNPAAQHYGP
jgi:hypothetical protein